MFPTIWLLLSWGNISHHVDGSIIQRQEVFQINKIAETHEACLNQTTWSGIDALSFYKVTIYGILLEKKN